MRRLLALTLVICLIGTGFPAPGYAAMISSDAAFGGERSRILSVLERSDVRAQLESLGVKSADLAPRVAALSDAEAAQLAAQLDSLPAGGDALGSIVSALLIIFLVLLITDILGFTKVFPFTRSVKK